MTKRIESVSTRRRAPTRARHSGADARDHQRPSARRRRGRAVLVGLPDLRAARPAQRIPAVRARAQHPADRGGRARAARAGRADLARGRASPSWSCRACRRTTGRERAYAFGLAAALMAIAVQGLVDYTVRANVVAMLALTLAAATVVLCGLRESLRPAREVGHRRGRSRNLRQVLHAITSGSSHQVWGGIPLLRARLTGRLRYAAHQASSAMRPAGRRGWRGGGGAPDDRPHQMPEYAPVARLPRAYEWYIRAFPASSGAGARAPPHRARAPRACRRRPLPG